MSIKRGDKFSVVADVFVESACRCRPFVVVPLCEHVG